MISQLLRNKYFAVKALAYRHIYIPLRARQIRKKKIINVLFPVGNLGAWKTELLYVNMLEHPRFNPILLIGKTNEEDDRDNLIRYCKEKGYQFHEDNDLGGNMWHKYHPDIIFYQKPYGDSFAHNLRSLFCYCPYGFRNSIEDWNFKTDLLYNSWQIYYENEALCHYYSSHMDRGIYNGFATGIPPMDELISPKEKLDDPWKGSKIKKRIIFAPHHSINPNNWWQTSTFLETGEIILEIAEKYSDRVQWAFKPHPLLRYKLEKIWGKDKTDSYYDKWSNSEWSQYESGKYLGLFKHSDAMIHDCGSFIMEYQATGKPVMYLTRDNNISSDWNDTVKKAYHLHYRGKSRQDIEIFIENIINNIDEKKEERLNFFCINMTPPNNTSASDNIIQCILSKKIANSLKK